MQKLISINYRGLASVSWSSKEVQDLFATENSSGDPTANPDDGSDPSDASSSSTPVGPIVGGVVGGVALVTIIGVVIFLFRRHSRRKTTQSQLDDSTTFTTSELGGHDVLESKPYQARPVVELGTDIPAAELDGGGIPHRYP